jgi:hypothetical protein
MVQDDVEAGQLEYEEHEPLHNDLIDDPTEINIVSPGETHLLALLFIRAYTIALSIH